ncbi:MAG: BspA family leucine-rich repeat surface protein, partial [Bacteroides sp.]
MKQILRVVIAAVLVVLLSLGSVARSFAQGGAGRPFITKWQGKAGEELKIPIVGTDYKLVIKNEKGEEVKTEEKVTVTGDDEAYYHPFTPTADGVYTVEAGPEGVKYMRMKAKWKEEEKKNIPITSNEQLLEVVQFGTVAWESMKQMFCRCKNMIFAADVDTPDLTKVSNMYEMFYYCSAFNQPLNNWDVSKVTNMGEMFVRCSAFNQPLNNWDVSKVTNMYGMFYDCSAFNQQLGEWNVSKVINMSVMFRGCSAFNQQLDNWTVSQVTNMYGMFYDCRAFNQPLNNWTVNQVTNMSEMFFFCSAFNQPLNNWDVSKVTTMGGMFAYCSAFNQPLEKWVVSQVTDMRSMFNSCHAFNQQLNNWNVSKVTDMRYMFRGCSAFNQPLGAWKLQTAIGDLSTTALSVENYSLSLIGWAKQTDGASNIKFGEEVKGLIYNDAGKEAREKLIARGWTFEGDVYQFSKKVAITLNKKGEGTLAIEGYNDEALQAVTLGIELTVIATPKKGYTLTSLMAGTQDILATKKFTVKEDVTVKAVFKETPKVAITLKKEGEGTLAIEGYNEEALKSVAVGTELTVIATPKDGYSLTSLTAGTQDILATKKFTVKEAVTVKAVFKEAPKVAISLDKEGEGTLAIEGYNEEALKAVTLGIELTVIATPKDGYSLTSLT